jgi:copper resistance protein D
MLAACSAVVFLLSPAAARQTSPQDQSTHSNQGGHQGMSMDMTEQTDMDAPYQRKLLADKKESEFNHHLAGFFVILAGAFTLVAGAWTRRWSFLRFVWPSCFLLAGLFLFIFSDTELWPFGSQSWWYGLTHNLEDLQHKIFAVILLALGVLEIQRARRTFKSARLGWVFPILACTGSVMLLFHEHHTGMHHAGHMETMARIQAEHRSFAATGFGIGICKGLSEVSTQWKLTFQTLWSLLMVVLGVLLMLYTE